MSILDKVHCPAIGMKNNKLCAITTLSMIGVFIIMYGGTLLYLGINGIKMLM